MKRSSTTKITFTFGLITLICSLIWLRHHRSLTNRIAEAPTTPSVNSSDPNANPVTLPLVTPPPIAPIETREQFNRAHVLIRKALPTANDGKELHQMLSDQRLMGYAAELLLDASATATTREAETKRMEAVDFLDAALMWKGNPKYRSAIRAISTVLQRPINDETISHSLKRSLAGDTVELFATLYREEPAIAQDLYNSVDESQRRLFGFGKNLVEQSKNSQSKKENS